MVKIQGSKEMHHEYSNLKKVDMAILVSVKNRNLRQGMLKQNDFK